MKKIFSVLVMLAPGPCRPFLYRFFLGYRIGRNVTLGFSYINAAEVIIGDNVYVGNFNRFKGLRRLEIGANANILTGNTFTSSFDSGGANEPDLEIGNDVGISLFHYFDVQDKLQIGAFATIAGVGSQFFTHFIDVVAGRQRTRPIAIGSYSMIGSGVRVAPGAVIADRSVVAMGSVVPGKHFAPLSLLAGNPCVVKRTLAPESEYFRRRLGRVSHSPNSADYDT